ncbi:IclR family transcriptional regulator [Synergistales bacterium]|nr:IclR family transcriptional regulator [Synergistales bacterium]
MSADSSLLKKGLAILLSFANTKSGQTASEISAKMGLPFSTTSRILKALEDEGFLERDSRGKQYRPGHNCYYLGTIAREYDILRRVSLPVMESLRHCFQETVIIYVREGDLRVYYEQLEGAKALKRMERVGSTAPLWVGSASRCLLAWTSNEDLERIYANIRPLCVNTILDKDAAIRNTIEVRESGYSISVSEREEGVCSVSVPILDAPRSVIASLTITGPALRFDDAVLLKMIPAMKDAAQRISKQLGNA